MRPALYKRTGAERYGEKRERHTLGLGGMMVKIDFRSISTAVGTVYLPGQDCFMEETYVKIQSEMCPNQTKRENLLSMDAQNEAVWLSVVA